MLLFLRTACAEASNELIERSRLASREYRFRSAVAAMEQAHSIQPKDSLLWREYALRLAEAHEFAKADSVWSEYLEVYSRDLEGYKNLFYCKTQGIADKELQEKSVWTAVARLPKNFSREQLLSVKCFAAGSLGDSAGLANYTDSLSWEFPLNKIGFDFLGEKFYDGMYPIWTDNKAKIVYCNNFIRTYEGSYWRNEAYLFLLSACNELGQRDSIFWFADRWMGEITGSPLPYLAAANWAMRLDTLKKESLVWSQRAYDNSLENSFPSLLDSMQREYQWRKLWIESREDYVWSLWKNNRTDDALKLLYSTVKKNPLDTEDDFTLAGIWTIGGWIYEGRSSDDSAKICYARALELGDRKNYWSGKADSALAKMKVSNRVELARELLNYRGPIFTDVTNEAGLSDRHESRVAWGDFDNDGDDDLLLNGSELFENQKGKFLNVTEEAGLEAGKNGGIFGDFNSDGYLDIIAIGNGDCGDRLYQGHYGGGFEDITDSSGVCDSVSSEGAGWGDVDNDGDLDLYVANYEKPGTLGDGTADILYLNLGNNKFARATDERGMTPPWGKALCGRGVNFCDFDRDGDEDLFVSNYRLQQNLLFVNDSTLSSALKAGWFSNRAPQYHVNGDEIKGWFGHTIGSEWGDLDNDGDFDLVSANLAHPRYIEYSNKTQILLNNGLNKPFTDMRNNLGIKYEETHSDPSLGDVNGDGFLDLYFTSIYEGRRSFLYLSEYGKKFRDITYLAGVRVMNGWGCAFSDYDQDGDLDLIAGSGSGVKLFRNDAPSTPFLRVVVQDEVGNSTGIGVQIEAKQGDKVWVREIEGGKGTTSQNSMTQIFHGFDTAQPLNLTISPLGREPLKISVTKFNRTLTLNLAAPEEPEER